MLAAVGIDACPTEQKVRAIALGAEGGQRDVVGRAVPLAEAVRGGDGAGIAPIRLNRVIRMIDLQHEENPRGSLASGSSRGRCEHGISVVPKINKRCFASVASHDH
jgi:hypothetical protein